MKNILLALLFFAVSSYAIDSLKINNTYVDSAVLTEAELNEDNDSCEVWSRRLVDTLNIAFPRWTDFNSGDSSLSRLNVDTIGDASGNVNLLLSTDNCTSPLKKFGFGSAVLKSWNTNYTALQIGDGGAIWSFDNGSEGVDKNLLLSVNGYYDAGSIKYIANDEYGDYLITNGTHNWRYGAPGAADAAVTASTLMQLTPTKLYVNVDTVDLNQSDLHQVGATNFHNPTPTLSNNTLTITTGTYLRVVNEVAGTDTLETITGGNDGDLLIIKAFSGIQDLFIDDGADNIELEGDFLLDGALDHIVLIKFNSSNWVELTRSNP